MGPYLLVSRLSPHLDLAKGKAGFFFQNCTYLMRLCNVQVPPLGTEDIN